MTRLLWLVLAFALASPASAQDTTAIRRQTARQDSLAAAIAKRSTSPTVDRDAAKVRQLAESIRVAMRKKDSVIVTPTPVPPKPDTSVIVVKPPVDTVVTPVPPSPIAPHPLAAFSNGAQLAELPRDTVPLDVPAPTRTIRVVSLQQAYDTAQTGDRLLIPANATTNDLYIRPTARAGWVTIQGTDSTSVIQTAIGGSVSAVNVLSKAHHVRFLGPLTIRSQTNALNALFRSYNGETSVADVPHHIIADGVTMDMGQYEGRRCAWADGAYIAIVRSRLLNCASKGGDAQAIIIGNGPGPYRFEGNYLEGGHQCFMSGGFDPAIPQSIPSDIVFRRNTCVKPLRWHYTTPGVYTGDQRQVKTVIETKNVRRALFESNTITNGWADAQVGFAFLLKSENQNCSAPWSQSSDITVRYNRVTNTASGINLAANPGSCPGVNAARITVYDNTFGPFDGSGDGITMQLLGPLSDAVLVHNTFASAGGSAVAFDGGAGTRTVISGNVIPHGEFGVKGSGSSEGATTLRAYTPGGLFTSNAVFPADCSLYPATTVCTSGPWPLAWDGRPIGADASKLGTRARSQVIIKRRKE